MRLPYPLPDSFTSPAYPGRAEVVRRLPRLADEITDAWDLRYDGEPRSGRTGVVLPVLCADGRRGALKLSHVDEDSAGEPVALQAWGGEGAVELWAADPRRGVMLLERLGPDDLTALDDLAACEVVGGLYRQLHRPPTPRLPDLRKPVARWLDAVRDLPTDAVPYRFVEQSLAAGARLLETEPTAVVHGDLHYENVLAGTRRDWLAIDPKGYAGDPAYELTPMLWNRWDELGSDPGARIRARFWALTDSSGLDERRCRDWVVVRAVVAVAWEYEDAAGAPLSAAQREQVTRCVTTAKAMQSV